MTVCCSDARKQQTQVIVDLGDGSDCRSGIPGIVFLSNRQCRTDAFDILNVRPVYSLKELSSVSRKRSDVAALAFSIKSVKGKTAFSTAGNSGNHRQGIQWYFDNYVLEIMDFCALDRNGVFLFHVQSLLRHAKRKSYFERRILSIIRSRSQVASHRSQVTGRKLQVPGYR